MSSTVYYSLPYLTPLNNSYPTHHCAVPYHSSHQSISQAPHPIPFPHSQGLRPHSGTAHFWSKFTFPFWTLHFYQFSHSLVHPIPSLPLSLLVSLLIQNIIPKVPIIFFLWNNHSFTHVCIMTSGVCLIHSLPFILRLDLSPNPRLTSLARQADQKSPGIHVSLCASAGITDLWCTWLGIWTHMLMAVKHHP